ncbi:MULTISPECIES: L,D-transpeptidase [Shouchella]|uniref:L,D-transpeptidase n=2 Tax=Bacillaceae TaxID=186817 RepID=A0A9D5I177_9BACI|nr:L,D-transpeptidase [Alkalicoccobacillus plakortidis]MBG9785764.1 L,D-transpeptidase [Shouchella lehensis]RQW20053.1 L,D-transpeptidase [Bacillus sp. C1-1]TES48230.1 L,D-transpeptidase [Shouchella lehensis]
MEFNFIGVTNVKWSFFLFTFVLLSTLLPDPFPVEKAAVIVNVQTNEMAIIEANRISDVFPVASGKKGEETPLGEFTVLVKAKQPYYRKKNIAGGDKRNPLGSRWIGFDANGTNGRTYGLHGTNQPHSIGYHASLGCVRLENTSVEYVYERVEIGSKVIVVKETKSFAALGKQYKLLK